ncbi:MAG: hypothetical protein WA080_09200 [Sulfuricurvum sp.]
MNTLSATLTSVTASEHLSLLTVLVGEDPFYLLLAQHCHEPIGTSLTLVFKETEVIVTTTKTATTANIQRALVRTIEQGKVLSQITLIYQATPIVTLVPTVTLATLLIHEGDEVYWMVQPSEISLLRETNGI